MATLLQYSTAPVMLMAGATTVTWTLTVTNGTSDADAAAVDQIVLTIPVGTTAGNLVPAFSDVSAGTPSGGWTCTLDADAGTITLAGSPLSQTDSFAVTFTLAAITDAASIVPIGVVETGTGVDNSAGFSISVTSTLLQYTLASTPNPLTEGATNAQLVVTVTNVTTDPNAAKVTRIRIQIPCGGSPGDLVPTPSDFSVGTLTNGWSSSQNGEYLTLTGAALTFGASFSVTLNLSTVTDQTGTSLVAVQEFYGGTNPNLGSFPITVFSSATTITGPFASPVNIIGTGVTSLLWSISNLDSSYTVSLVYIVNGVMQTASNASSGQCNSPTLDTTTVFTLQIFDGSDIVYQSQIAVSVMPPMPTITSFTGDIAWDTATGCPSLTLQWQTGNAAYCTLTEDGDLKSPQGSVIYPLGSVKTAAQEYTLTAVNLSGSVTGTICLDWSQAAMNQPSGAQVVCPVLICSALTGNVYGISGGTSPVLNIIEFDQTPTYSTITPGGTANCNTFAAAPQASLTSGVSDTLYVVVDGDLQQWAVDLTTPSVTSQSVTGWPTDVTIASTDVACLIGASGGTIAVACASAPGTVQIVAVTSSGLSWSSAVDLTADITTITNLVPLNLLDGFIATDNATTGAVGYVLPTSTATAISYPTTPIGAVASADGTEVWIFDLPGAITLFDVAAAMPSDGAAGVTVTVDTATYLWNLFPTADGGALVGLYGGSNQLLINTVASIALPTPGLAISSAISCYVDTPSTSNWNVQGGSCLTNGWPTVVLSTAAGFQIVRTAAYATATASVTTLF